VDLFTHVLVSFLIGLGFNFPLRLETVLYIVIAGTISDGDVFLHPLSSKYKWASHHGGSHSIIFILLYSIIVSFLYVQLSSKFGGYPLTSVQSFGFAFLPGIMHIVLDFLTSWSVPIFWPFSNKEYKFEIERAVNPFTILFSFSSTVFMFAFWPSEFVIKTIVFFLFAYFVFRVMAKLYLIKKKRKEGYVTDAASTNLPYVWYVVHDKSDENRIFFSWYKTNLFSERKYESGEFSLKKDRNIEFPIDSEEKAMQYSFNIDEVERYLSKFKYPVGRAIKENGHWKVCWSALEMSMSKFRVAVVVLLEQDGRYRTSRGLV